MKISWVILTYNREATVRRAITQNMEMAGDRADELIYVDNGSTDMVTAFFAELEPDVAILNKTNLGVAKGYNRGVALSTGDWILVTGCDRLMPIGWLHTVKELILKIPETGAISIYSQPFSKVPERMKYENAGTTNVRGTEIVECLPMGAKIFSRRLLNAAGHLREDFGLYGWEDVEWGNRLQRVAKEMGLLCYSTPSLISEHLGSEGIESYNGIDTPTYHEFKHREATDPRKQQLMEWCRANNWPYYSPY